MGAIGAMMLWRGPWVYIGVISPEVLLDVGPSVVLAVVDVHGAVRAGCDANLCGVPVVRRRWRSGRRPVPKAGE